MDVTLARTARSFFFLFTPSFERCYSNDKNLLPQLWRLTVQCTRQLLALCIPWWIFIFFLIQFFFSSLSVCSHFLFKLSQRFFKITFINSSFRSLINMIAVNALFRFHFHPSFVETTHKITWNLKYFLLSYPEINAMVNFSLMVVSLFMILYKDNLKVSHSIL